MPLANVQTREMTADDIARVVEIESDAYSFPWSTGIFCDCMRVGYECRVLEMDGEVIGYGILSALVREAHVLNLCLARPFRRLGLGRVLLGHLLRVAAQARVNEVFLEVRPTNTQALKLYRSFGFEQVGVRQNYYRAGDGREDALVLCAHVDAQGQPSAPPGFSPIER